MIFSRTELWFIEDKLSSTAVDFIRSDEVYSSRWKLVFNESTVLFQRKSTTSNVTTEWEIYTKTSGISLPEVHGIGKGSDPNMLPEKQVIKPITSEMKGVTQTKPRLGQGRAGIKWRIKLPVPHHFINPL